MDQIHQADHFVAEHAAFQLVKTAGLPEHLQAY
jgi:hypothetical protein